jgi:hypothetical protein
MGIHLVLDMFSFHLLCCLLICDWFFSWRLRYLVVHALQLRSGKATGVDSRALFPCCSCLRAEGFAAAECNIVMYCCRTCNPQPCMGQACRYPKEWSVSNIGKSHRIIAKVSANHEIVVYLRTVERMVVGRPGTFLVRLIGVLLVGLGLDLFYLLVSICNWYHQYVEKMVVLTDPSDMTPPLFV